MKTRYDGEISHGHTQTTGSDTNTTRLSRGKTASTLAAPAPLSSITEQVTVPRSCRMHTARALTA